MFVDKPIGDPLKRKQLKWLLVILGVLMVVAVLVISFRLMNESIPDPEQPLRDKNTMQTKPTQDEIQKQLDMLAAEDAKNPAPKPTQEEIEKQLEALAAEDAKNPAPKPTQEEIEKQMEMLSKQ